MQRKEPKPFRRGKEFHAILQREWKRDAQGEVAVEKTVIKRGGRRGRVDVLIDADDDLMVVVEMKASDWDRMAPNAVRRNVLRQARQIWDYIESQLAEDKDVSPGVIFPKQPKSQQRLNLIEKLFEEQGISVVWQDETIKERKARSGAPK